MNVALRQPMSLPEFLAWEEEQELRYELEYQQTPSIQRYLIQQQDSIAATVFERGGESWKATLTESDVLPMPGTGIDCRLRIATQGWCCRRVGTLQGRLESANRRRPAESHKRKECPCQS
ncbi:MAG: hypothetical protein JO212_04485 [Acetobacteraceae bacterium]|nr:hypothetical protein [Acetobacteraceae bacterium]